MQETLFPSPSILYSRQTRSEPLAEPARVIPRPEASGAEASGTCGLRGTPS